MTETQVAFLYKAASVLQQTEQSQNLTLLRSYYLMCCKAITKGYGLPEKHFSSKVRCSHCCIEWKKGSKIRVKSIKFSKKQRHRINTKKVTKNNKDYVKARKELLHSNEMHQICSFCKHNTITPVPKPEKFDNESLAKESNIDIVEENTKKNKKKSQKKESNVMKADMRKKIEVNVYSATKEVFSLKNTKNTISSTVKETAKVIKNNKRKKDRFAGLCRQAVLASVKMKEAKDKQNKFTLFLKPSS